MRVLIVALGGLTQVAPTLAVTRDIHAVHRGSVVDWVVETPMVSLLRRVEGVGDVIEHPSGAHAHGLWASAAQKKAAERLASSGRAPYDAVIDLGGDSASAWIAAKAKGRQHFAAAEDPDGRARPLLARLRGGKTIAVGHVPEPSRQVVARALGHTVSGPARVALRTRVAALQRPTVAFVHGSAGEAALWPEARWVALGRKFVDHGWDLMLLHGGEEELVRSERLAAAIDSQVTAFRHEVMKAGPVVNVWPEMQFGIMAERLVSCHAVIGIDSGPSHLAAALDLPHVRLHNRPVSAAMAAALPPHQAVVGADTPPAVEAVWAAWRQIEPHARARIASAQR